MLGRGVVLVLPAAILLLGSFYREGRDQTLLWTGTLFQVLLFCWMQLSQRVLKQPLGLHVSLLYLSAFAWFWLAHGFRADWYSAFAQSILLVVPLVTFGLQALNESGAFASRRARQLTFQLTHKKDWPVTLDECHDLPEVKALREALSHDATPALALLQHPKSQVRMAALCALENRATWRPGQPELVLYIAKQVIDPAIRAAALRALGNIEDRHILEALAEFLRDPSRVVRQAALETLHWEAESRWPWVRSAIRNAMSDPACEADGALRFEGGSLKPDIVGDLSAWATEKGSLGMRAAMTLGGHYSRAMNEASDPNLIPQLKEQLGDPHAPPALRMELGQLLFINGELDRPLLERLLDAANPGSLRLLAAEALLEEGPHGHAVNALREISRLPNREMALSAANVVQRRLGVDLGLAVGQPLPPLQSKQAADVTRRLMKWAANQDVTSRQEAESSLEIDINSPEPRTWGQKTPEPGGQNSGVKGIGTSRG